MAQINNGETGLSARTKINESIAKTDQITDVGGGVIPSSAQLSKVDSITDVGGGVIPSTAQLFKLDTIEESAQVNAADQVFFGRLTSSGTNIILDEEYSTYTASTAIGRSTSGEYVIYNDNITVANTFVTITPSQSSFISAVVSSGRITIETADTSGTLADDILTSAVVKIENYPL